MTVEDAMRRLLEIFPDMQVGDDADGQLVVYTGCRVSKDFELTPFPTEEV